LSSITITDEHPHEQLDPTLGFYYLRARYYQQATGRFGLSEPPEDYFQFFATL
jgi:uncharacterized protein RhaS with RHS repeats